MEPTLSPPAWLEAFEQGSLQELRASPLVSSASRRSASLSCSVSARGFEGEIRFHEPLKNYTYFRIGGPAAVLASPRSLADLEWLASRIQQTGCPFFILGKGSNLLVCDQGYQGLVIRTQNLNKTVQRQGAELVTGASVLVGGLVRQAALQGWGGLEFLTGIPGSMGGVVAMNAGTHQGAAASRLKGFQVFSLLGSSTAEDPARDIAESKDEPQALRLVQALPEHFQYRKNHFLQPGSLIYSATWAIEEQSPAWLQEQVAQMNLRRKATQPVDQLSCGSVFKNPTTLTASSTPASHASPLPVLQKAWEVIDALGLRGLRQGAAQFSEKHSNFIINHKGEAKASDVKVLIEHAQRQARERMGIVLETEVVYLGLAEVQAL